MRKFTIAGILAAAKCFEREEEGNKALEDALRDVESKKQSISQESIVTIDEQSLYEAFGLLVAGHCLSKVVMVVVMKYSELGYELVE